MLRANLDVKKCKIPDVFSYLYDVVRCVAMGAWISITEFDLMGGRKSGKTTALIFCWILMCYFAPSGTFGWIAFRASEKGRKDLIEDVIQLLNQAGVRGYKVNKGDSTIELNGNTLYIRGLNSMSKTKAAVAGLPRFSNVKYIFVFFEERYEFTADQISAIKEAIRGTDKNTQKIFLSACNPWGSKHFYIRGLLGTQPFNLNKMKVEGSQCGVYEKVEYVKVLNRDTNKMENVKYVTNQLIHYTNWRVTKDFLTDDEIRSILETWQTNPTRAAVVDWGRPGFESTQIYTHVLHYISKAVLDKEYDAIIGGLDYGWGRDNKSGKTVALFGTYSQDNGIDIFNEYVQDNHKVTKTPNVVAREVVDFYYQSMNMLMNDLHLYEPENMVVFVDNAANVFISMLNEEVAKRGGRHWLHFKPCHKYPINDRIEATIGLIGKQKLRVHSNVKLLLEELEMSYYEDVETQKRNKDNDHALNAFEYMFEKYMYKMLKDINPFRKQRIIC